MVLPSLGFSANFDNCSQNFYGNQPPQYTKQTLLKQSIPLCFNGFATLYSGVSLTPLWSAEHLTAKRLYQAEELPREDSFHSETRLPARLQAQLSDYKGSGYDRGHLAPNADMATLEQQYDSFSLANMIPQAPDNNRQVWRNLESVTRYLTKKHGEVYVITGVAFNSKQVKQLNARIIVPTHVFKAIYIPATGEAGAYYAPNNDSKQVEVISIDELTRRSGIETFPTINANAKATAPILATQLSDIPDREAFDKGSKQKQEDPLWLQIVIEILKWLVSAFSSK